MQSKQGSSGSAPSQAGAQVVSQLWRGPQMHSTRVVSFSWEPGQNDSPSCPSSACEQVRHALPPVVTVVATAEATATSAVPPAPLEVLAALVTWLPPPPPAPLLSTIAVPPQPTATATAAHPSLAHPPRMQAIRPRCDVPAQRVVSASRWHAECSVWLQWTKSWTISRCCGGPIGASIAPRAQGRRRGQRHDHHDRTRHHPTRCCLHRAAGTGLGVPIPAQASDLPRDGRSRGGDHRSETHAESAVQRSAPKGD